mmetsp:Transcript_73505/g.209178  ORF Transcript_73505/g.209178 Transcript_73505/m.209178 type:complete len:564 (+) Transcript_73505:74-1765(+)|eukprot:CAMPEP_0119502868 /NCGR_PEP_ID=MMETSP1344-20130328/24203_1 /TAXON_ID=236787 /ORGANISM="Florenciella parvula, Strain CCMP2471" /LENGTH=563 /DNA_ID=CAMNT_0007539107 /DNA_START=47 /DNA_END=1738 /DNA_ORIENTATION=+
MSTLLSTDLNVTRSTTRRLAPPGGGSSISLAGQSPAKSGDDMVFGATVTRQPPTSVRENHPTGAGHISFGASEDPTATPKTGRKHAKEASSIDLSDGLNQEAAESTAPVAAPTPVVAASVAVAAAAPKYLAEIKVGVATVTTEEMSAQLQVSFSSAASAIGAVTFSCAVSSIFQLPAATQQLAKECDLVIAIFSIESNFSNSMISALATIAASTGVPCLQGVYASGADPAGISSLWVQDVAALTSRGVGSTAPATPAGAAAALVIPNGASALSAAPEAVVQQDPIDTLLTQLRTSLKKHGAKGIVGLGRKFRIIDDDGSGHLSKSEFQKAVKEHVLDWTDQEFSLVFDHFDADHGGSISYDEFLVGVRGELNERRKQLVLLAFKCLDKTGNNLIELDDIMDAYTADKHPDVIAGRKTKNQVLREFLDTFDSPDDKDGKVTPTEFCRYYGNISASIDDDDYFELMIRNAWHISGGEGWCANTSCRRVLVTHADGSQSVEEIQNDLGITAEDKDAMKANLEAQGIDVTGMSLTGSLDTTEPPANPSGPPPRTPKGKTQSSSVVLG